MKIISQLAICIVGAAARVLRQTPLVRWRWLGALHENIVWKLRGDRNEFKVGPFRVFVDPRDKVIAGRLALYGSFEAKEIDLLCSLVRPGDCVMDIGANIGLHSLALSRAVGPEGQVISFEPDQDNLALLRKNLETNGCTNVTVIPAALGEQEGAVDLYQSDDNRGALSTSDILGVGSENAVSVQMRRGDAVLAELGLKARVAKIDVEGAEPLVMSGLGSAKPEILLFEFVPWQLRAAGHDPLLLLKGLEGEGYKLDLVDPETGLHQTMRSSDLLVKVEAESSDRNVLAVRS